jgi:hypothetical protein
MPQGPSRMHAYILHLPPQVTRSALIQPFTHLANLEDSLITLFPQLNQGKVDNPLQQATTQSNQVPPPVSFSVTQKNGLSFVNIGLPQLQTPQSPVLFALQAARGQNSGLAPIYHRVQSAASEAFDGSLGIATYILGVGTWTLPDVNSQWRLQSTFDTVTFNDFSAPKTADILP